MAKQTAVKTPKKNGVAPGTPKSRKSAKKPVKQPEPQDIEDSEEEEMPVTPVATKRKTPAKNNPLSAKKAKQAEDMEVKVAKTPKSAAKKAKTKPVKKAPSPPPADEDEEDDEEMDDEEDSANEEESEDDAENGEDKENGSKKIEFHLGNLPQLDNLNRLVKEFFASKGIKLSHVFSPNRAEKNFGIVALANDNDKKKMESLGECDFEGQKIRVSVHMAKEVANKTRVYLMSSGIKSESLKKLAAGAQVTCVKPKPFGWLTFPSVAQAEEFMKKGTIQVDGHTLSLKQGIPSKMMPRKRNRGNRGGLKVGK